MNLYGFAVFLFIAADAYLIYTLYSARMFSGIFLALGMMFIVLYLVIRIRLVSSQIQALANAVKRGDFEPKLSYKTKDYLDTLVYVLNKAIGDIKEIDTLRKQRTTMYYKALSHLFHDNKDAMIWIDREKDVFRLNPKSQAFFGVEQMDFSLQGILNLPDNQVFALWLEKLFQHSSIAPLEITEEVSLPSVKAKRVVYIEAFTVKDDSNEIKIVFLKLKP